MKRLSILLLLPLAFCETPPPDPGTEKPPTIDYFRANPKTISRGDQVQLEWSVQDAEEVFIEPTIGKVRRLVGRRKDTPQESLTYRLVATNEHGTRARERSVTVEVPPVTVEWQDIKREPFGSRAVPGEGVLHLGAVDTVDALKALDDILLWNGIRNPQAALQCSGWDEYNGHNRNDIPDIVLRDQMALDLLRETAFVKSVDRVNTLVGGKMFRDGEMDKEEWESIVRDVVRQAIVASELDGIRSLCE